jgi:hypothetical protein
MLQCSLVGSDKISRVLINQITDQPDTLEKNKISLDDLEKISHFIREKNIQRAYIGVPSINNEVPFQIANHLDIPCTIAYEYMFKPANHSLWNYIDGLAVKENCDFAVPLISAKNDILEINKNAKICEIGHLSIDRSQMMNLIDSTPVRESLSINKEDKFIFISGTTQPTEVDNQFLDALLSEISTGKYPGLQLRMGLHPGVKDPDSYLQTLLKTCERYSIASNQFKIILTTPFEKKLQNPTLSSPFIFRSEVSGADAAQAADKVAQAVPGALLNEAALKGKPSYFHDETAVPYLPKKWFSGNLTTFFTAKPEPSHSRKELGLEDTAPNLLAKHMMR